MTNNPQTISEYPINDIGRGVTLIQNPPNNKHTIAKIKESILKLKYHKTKDKGPDKRTAKNIIATIKAKDSMLIPLNQNLKLFNCIILVF